MKYVVEVDGVRQAVTLDGGAVVEPDGRREAVGLEVLPGSPVRLLRVGEARHRVVVRRGPARGQWTLDIGGTRYAVEAMDERARAIRDLAAAHAPAAGPAPLVAPMPGLVVRVQVREGDRVEAGQGVVVMEAMKMENELRAPAAAVVLAVRVAPGTPVEKGAVLVELGVPVSPAPGAGD